MTTAEESYGERKSLSIIFINQFNAPCLQVLPQDPAGKLSQSQQRVPPHERHEVSLLPLVIDANRRRICWRAAFGLRTANAAWVQVVINEACLLLLLTSGRCIAAPDKLWLRTGAYKH